MINLVLVCAGSHGDLRPFVAIGAGLKHAGYRVRIVTDPNDKDFCQSWGLELAPLEGNLATIVQPQNFNKKQSTFEKVKFLPLLLKTLSQIIDRQSSI